jgi:hypothetical protein
MVALRKGVKCNSENIKDTWRLGVVLKCKRVTKDSEDPTNCCRLKKIRIRLEEKDKRLRQRAANIWN